MDALEGPLTRSGLVEAAQRAGLLVTEEQIIRWHKAGIISRPQAPGLGRGRGRIPYYPPGTDRQLFEALRLHREYRNLNDVQWFLWWAGYPVDLGAVRRQLAMLASQVDYFRRSAVDPDQEDLSEEVMRQIDEASERRLPPSLGRLRRRAGRSRFPTALRLIIQVMAGQFRGFESDAVSGQDEEQPILIDALGLRSAQRGPDAWLPADVGPAVARMNQILSATSFTDLLERTGDDQLATARDAARDLVTTLMQCDVRSHPAFKGLATLATDVKKPRDQAWMVLVTLLFGPKIIRGLLVGA